MKIYFPKTYFIMDIKTHFEKKRKYQKKKYLFIINVEI